MAFRSSCCPFLYSGAVSAQFCLKSNNSINPSHFWQLLSRISLYVANNCGFWMRWIDLLDLHQS
jgi:hypothetical protein